MLPIGLTTVETCAVLMLCYYALSLFSGWLIYVTTIVPPAEPGATPAQSRAGAVR